MEYGVEIYQNALVSYCNVTEIQNQSKLNVTLNFVLKKKDVLNLVTWHMAVSTFLITCLDQELTTLVPKATDLLERLTEHVEMTVDGLVNHHNVSVSETFNDNNNNIICTCKVITLILTEYVTMLSQKLNVQVMMPHSMDETNLLVTSLV